MTSQLFAGKPVKSVLKNSFSCQSNFTDFRVIQNQGSPTTDSFSREINVEDRAQNGSGVLQSTFERRDRKGMEIKKGSGYKITFKDQLRRIKSGENLRENVEDFNELEDEDEQTDQDQRAYSDQDESPTNKKARMKKQEEGNEEEEEREGNMQVKQKQQADVRSPTNDVKHYSNIRARFKKGKREKLEDVIYVESYKEYNAQLMHTNQCCCIL